MQIFTIASGTESFKAGSVVYEEATKEQPMDLLNDGIIGVQRMLDHEVDSGPGGGHVPIMDQFSAKLLRVVSI